ncbi:DUF6058 family natural product biosynthesis protein [Micromonospora yasonensis]|uniref:DUF6058 family natural product biosynthesis protein n=1 Tax=Micromonospora yasonensis TaxID=1128667 RepID=UPI0022312792|nr:DUF6058 family natural product biosynthesis protein [Micromonospora yasonensis]MCW3843764.1 DUF6058 family natural product biosynthesis protein [Micromonospora yasonensis]
MQLRQRVAERFRQVNGVHPMTAADDAYVNGQFVVLDDLCAATGRDPNDVRRLMLDRRLPLPGYLRSDGAEMVPADLFALAERAGGAARLPEWFVGQWADRAQGAAEWDAYLSGQYVCLHSVSPETIRRKDELTVAIRAAPAEPDAGSAAWLDRLHALVDELDALEPAFTGYDRLRFGGPTSRDTCVDAVRAGWPRLAGLGDRVALHLFHEGEPRGEVGDGCPGLPGGGHLGDLDQVGGVAPGLDLAGHPQVDHEVSGLGAEPHADDAPVGGQLRAGEPGATVVGGGHLAHVELVPEGRLGQRGSQSARLDQVWVEAHTQCRRHVAHD